MEGSVLCNVQTFIPMSSAFATRSDTPTASFSRLLGASGRAFGGLPVPLTMRCETFCEKNWSTLCDSISSPTSYRDARGHAPLTAPILSTRCFNTFPDPSSAPASK